MADNTRLSVGTNDGDTYRSLEDGSSVKWAAGVCAFATTIGTPDVLQAVTPTAGLPVQLSDGSGAIVTLPVSLASVPSHAVTNAGTFAVQVDGTALTRLTDIETNTDSGAVVNNGAAATAQRVTLANDSTGVIATVGAVTAITNALPAGTNAIGKLAANNGVDIGDVDVASIAAGDNNIGNVDIATVPADPFGVNADAASATGSISAKLRFIAATGIPITGTVTVGSHAVTNAGTFVTQIDGAALTALQLLDNVILVDDAAFTPASSSVSMAGFQADETATDSVDEGDAGAARMTLDRKQIVTPYPHTAGGLAIHRSLDLDEGTLEVVKNAPGQLYGGFVTNLATATRYIKFYDATSGTAGTGTPVITIAVPGNATDDIGATFNTGGMGIAFATGICVGATTGFADNDTGGPGANEVIVNFWYK